MRPAARIWLLVALALTTLLTLNGRHYWHEIRFAYAVNASRSTKYCAAASIRTRCGGDRRAVIGRVLRAKILHLVMLKSLFSIVPPSRGGFELAITLSLVLMGLTALVAHEIFHRVFGDAALADLGLVCFLLIPVVPYLAGKLMSEVPALFFAALATLTGQRVADRVTVGLTGATVCGVLTSLAMLSRLDLVLLVVAFWVATFAREAGSERRQHIFRGCVFSLAIAASGYLIVMFLTGGDLRSIVAYFGAVADAGTRSPLMSALSIVTFGGCIYLASLFAPWSERRSARAFFFLWLLLTAGPMLVVTSRYMVEPRYLIHAAIPLAGLGALGIEAAARRFSLGAKATVTIVVAALGMNWIFLRVMPYELNRPEMLSAVQLIRAEESDAAILTPWAYTDFHFLKLMRPDIPVFNINGDLPGDQPTSLNDAWQRRSVHWYGQTFLNSPARLQELLETRPVYYLGWHRYPPIESVEHGLRAFGLASLADIVGRLQSKDHLHESWVWRSRNYSFAEGGRSGQYVYGRVTANN